MQFAEIQSFPRQVLARSGRNTSAQPYRGMHLYAGNMNIAVLMRENVAVKKMCMRKSVQKLTAVADPQLDNHVVYNLTTGKRLCSLIRKLFQKDNATFTSLQNL